MSTTIKLKVPAEPEAEFVSQGNFHAELAPNSTIETKSRSFADWLILRHGLTEIKPRTKAAPPSESPFAAGYAEDFPGRDALVAAEIPFETMQGLTREQLLKVPNIGDQTATAILEYSPAPPAPIAPAATGEQEEETTAGGEPGSQSDAATETTDGGEN